MTPHISAKLGDIAPLVLLSGDPVRTQVMSERFLTGCKLVSKVRKLLIFTGYYQDTLISIASSGMGQPSTGIIAYELFNFYKIKAIIRVGTCGAFLSSLFLEQILLVKDAFSLTPFFPEFYCNDWVAASPFLNDLIKTTAQEENIPIFKDSRVWSTNEFYGQNEINNKALVKINGLDAVEMEAFVLFILAKLFHGFGACLLSVSDFVFDVSHQKKANDATPIKEMSPEERVKKLDKMFLLALKSLVKFNQIKKVSKKKVK